MTYNEIISIVCRRLGYQGFSGIGTKLKNDLRNALIMAENELMQETDISQETITVNLTKSAMQYNLGSLTATFGQTHEIIIYDTQYNRLLHVEVPYDRWLSWQPKIASVDSTDLPNLPMSDISDIAEFSNRVVVSIHYNSSGGDAPVGSGYILSVKPPLDGYAVINYTSTPSKSVLTNIDSGMNLSPSIPDKFHQYIIAGAVYYLSQIEAGDALSKGDFVRAQFYQNIEARAYGEFRQGINVIRENKRTMDNAVVAKAFTWYNDIRHNRWRW